MEDSFPDPGFPVFVSLLDTPCSLAGDCPSAPGVFEHNGWQTLAFISITVFRLNGICHIPSWLALMWGDFPLPNDR